MAKIKNRSSNDTFIFILFRGHGHTCYRKIHQCLRALVYCPFHQQKEIRTEQKLIVHNFREWANPWRNSIRLVHKCRVHQRRRIRQKRRTYSQNNNHHRSNVLYNCDE